MTAAPARTAPPAPAARPAPVLRRCACGGRAPGGGECEECKARRMGLRRSATSAAAPGFAPPLVHDVLRSPGRPLDAGTRAWMEPRFGHSFADVRIHADGRAAQSADAVSARAYAVGRDIVFGAGAYAPGSMDGRRLIAHELAHVVQQSASVDAPPMPALEVGSVDAPEEREAEAAARAAALGPGASRISVSPADAVRRLRRATFTVGSLTVQVDYGGVAGVPAPDVQARVESQYTAYTGAPVAAVQPAIAALSIPQRRWLMFALDLLADNTTAAHAALNRVQAVQRLITQAPASTTAALGSAGYAFEHEVLRVAGWFEVALPAPLPATSGADLAFVQSRYNRPSVAPPGSALNVALLTSLLVPALNSFLTARDPANWGATVTLPLAPIQAVGTEIQALARSFFAPWSDTATSTPYATGWNYAAQMGDATTAPITPDLRVSYLTNRAKIVGDDATTGPSIFSQANFDSSVPADAAALDTLVNGMLTNASTTALVDRLLQHTGRANPATHDVWVNTEFPAAANQCNARWSTIRTVCHELLHVLAHPRFRAQAQAVRSDQLIREGFTEVLGVQLYDHVRTRAGADPALKGRLEAGVPGAPCPAPPATAIGYGRDGADAEAIRNRVHDDNFRAAYFLGAVDRVGL